MDHSGEEKCNDTCSWTFKEKQKGPQIRGKKAQSEVDRRVMWRSPSADSSPIMQVSGWGSYKVNEDWGGGGGVRLGGGMGGMDDGCFFTHDLSGTRKINECALVYELSPTHKHHWFPFTSRLVSWFISIYRLKCRNLDKRQKVQRRRVLELCGSRSTLCLPPSLFTFYFLSVTALNFLHDFLISKNTDRGFLSAHASLSSQFL